MITHNEKNITFYEHFGFELVRKEVWTHILAYNLIRLVRWIHEKFDVSIWMIEHHMDVVMELCSHIKVIDFGQTIAEGTPDEIRSHPAVITAYLGDDNI